MLMVFAPIAVQKSLYIMHLGTYPRHRWPTDFAEEATFTTPFRSWIKISQIRTLAVERIGEKIDHTTPEGLAYIIEGLNEIIGN
jgi:hypothetical protein